MPDCEIYCNGHRLTIPDIITNMSSENNRESGQNTPSPTPLSPLTQNVDFQSLTLMNRPRTPPSPARTSSPRHRSPSPNYVAFGRRTPSPYRRSPSPLPPGYGGGSRRNSNTTNYACGYDQYQMSLLEVPWTADYGDASSDDLSSEWDSDVPDAPPTTSKVCIK